MFATYRYFVETKMQRLYTRLCSVDQENWDKITLLGKTLQRFSAKIKLLNKKSFN